ncbi:MAG: hypothetical protein IKK43_02990 [Clostridia bacterium]|nr:hypothetical protein [Clostridia bacterium]
MNIRPESLEFLKVSQKLSGAVLLITNNEHSVIEINQKGEISYENKKINDEMKNLEGDRKKDRNEMIKIFANDPYNYSAQIIRRLYKAGEPAGFLAYYSEKGDFSDSIEEFADTAKYFIERMLDEHQEVL